MAAASVAVGAHALVAARRYSQRALRPVPVGGDALPLGMDTLFLTLAPAWAHQHHRTYSSVSTSARRSRAAEWTREGSSNNSPRVAQQDEAWDEASPSSTSTSSGWRHDDRAHHQVLREWRKDKSSHNVPTVSLNNYLLALGRAYRTPPPAYIHEAIQILYRACRGQLARDDRITPATRTGPDRMTFDIVLDMLARAIPLHTQYNHYLSEERRKGKQKATPGGLPTPPGSDSEAYYEYGTSQRIPAFVEDLQNTTHYLAQRLHINPPLFIARLRDFLDTASKSAKHDKMHFFPQSQLSVEAAADAEKMASHPGPSRISKHKLAKMVQQGEQKPHPQSAKDTSSTAGSNSDGQSPTDAPTVPPPKTNANLYITLFTLVYRYMLDRYPTRPSLQHAHLPDFPAISKPQFIRHPSVRNKLVGSGTLGPGGPSWYAYAARILAFQRMRDWDEVRAAVRECVARAYWEPPLILDNQRSSGRRDDPTLPAGWTEAQIRDVLLDTYYSEQSMFNIHLLTHVLWAWVRVQAPSSPHAAPPEEWEYDEGESGASGRGDGQKEEAHPFDSSLGPSSASPQSRDAQAAIEETVRRIREVYDLLRENAILQEWERMSRLEAEETGDSSTFGAPSLPIYAPPGQATRSSESSSSGKSASPSLVVGERVHWADGQRRVREEIEQAGLERTFASYARQEAVKGWSKDKVWLMQMRVLLRYDKRRMNQLRATKKEGEEEGRGQAPPAALPSPSSSRNISPMEEMDDAARADANEARDDEGRLPASGKKKLPAETTLRLIFGLPSHPSIRPQLPPHIVADAISYVEFIRLFTHLGHWQHAVEVLADYQQTPLPGASEADDDDEQQLGGRRQSNADARGVVNEVMLPMFDAFFRGYSQHAVPPIPNQPAHVLDQLTRIQHRVQDVFDELGFGSSSENDNPVVGLDLGAVLDQVSPQGRGWTLESLVFMFEAFLRIRPDCGPDSVARRQRARESWYQEGVARRRAEAVRARGLDGGARYEDPSMRDPDPPAFFDRSVPSSLDSYLLQMSDLPHSQSETFDDLRNWMGPVGRALLDHVYGSSTRLAPSAGHPNPAAQTPDARLQSRFPHRFLGHDSQLLEVDAHGHVRGFQRAPVPRQLFWILTALRRATSDHAPDWVLEQWTRLMHKFGPDLEMERRLMEEERAWVEMKRRMMHLRPEEAAVLMREGGGAAQGRRGGAGRQSQQDDEVARAANFLYGTGKDGSVQLASGTQTDANREGWYAWRFPQRRMSRVIQYLTMRAGMEADSVRLG
ncbi:hypothetical protein V8E36_001384 [Tilletia maclaganii]